MPTGRELVLYQIEMFCESLGMNWVKTRMELFEVNPLDKLF